MAVSVFHDNSLNWQPNNRLFDVEFNWDDIRKNAPKLMFVHSDDDPYVPLDHAKFVADNCLAEIAIIPGQGHFNLEQSPDYKQFPKLTALLKRAGLIPKVG